MRPRCSLGVGCEAVGKCYAIAQGQPTRCGRDYGPGLTPEEGWVLEQLYHYGFAMGWSVLDSMYDPQRGGVHVLTINSNATESVVEFWPIDPVNGPSRLTTAKMNRLTGGKETR